MATAGQVWFVTGASSGFGEALAEAVIEAGGTVMATFRKSGQASDFDAKASGRSFGIEMDVTDKRSVDAGIAAAIARFGRIDVLVNNAGYALRGLVEQVSDEEAIHQIDTNVLGVLRVTRAALPYMRERGSGHIMNIASAAGSVGFPMMAHYAASKHAVVGLSDALSKEVAALGIKVTSVEPGAFRTKFGSSSMITPEKAAPGPYAPIVEQIDASIENFNAIALGDPKKAALKLLDLAAMDDPPTRLALGDDALPWITGALEQRIEEYKQYSELGQGTSFDE